MEKTKRKNAPKKVQAALLIIDMINDLDFPEGPKLLKHAVNVAKKIARLKKRFQKNNLTVIYVNDNFGDWKSDWKLIFKRCRAPYSIGKSLAKTLKPEASDYFILKPMHSGFYATPLEILLERKKIKKVIVVGIAGNICVLFTAHDAYMRGFSVIVPKDCIASNTKIENRYALKQLEGLSISTKVSGKIVL